MVHTYFPASWDSDSNLGPILEHLPRFSENWRRILRIENLDHEQRRFRESALMSRELAHTWLVSTAKLASEPRSEFEIHIEGNFGRVIDIEH